MRKIFLALGIGLSLVAAGSLTASAFTCKVKKLTGDQAVLKCKAKDAKKLAPGDKVKLKKKTEGC